MSRRALQILMVFAACVFLMTGFVACGGDSASQEELDQARTEGEEQALQQAKIEDIEKQLKSLRGKNKNGRPSSSPPPASSSDSVSGSNSSCGGGLSVGANTTCGFASNVQADYYSEIGSGAGTVYSYSPTTGQSYTMYCSAGSPHVCTGGNSASVYFP